MAVLSRTGNCEPDYTVFTRLWLGQTNPAENKVPAPRACPLHSVHTNIHSLHGEHSWHDSPVFSDSSRSWRLPTPSPPTAVRSSGGRWPGGSACRSCLLSW